MSYEVKSVRPVSVFFNALRIFLIVGFVVAVLSFFVLPSQSVAIRLWWQKCLAAGLFTVVYAAVVSFVMVLIARIYNAWTLEFEVQPLFVYNAITFFMAACFVGIAKFLMGLGGGFFSSLGTTLVFVLLFTLGMSVAATLLIRGWHAVFGASKGVSLELAEGE